MNKKITILVFNLGHGGAEKVCLTLCNELVKRNYEVELWVADFKKTSLTNSLNKKVSVFPLNKKKARNTLFPIIKLLLKQKPKKLLVFHIELAIIVIILKKILFLKTEIIIRSINTLSQAFVYPNGFWEKYIAKKAIKYFLHYSDKIIAQSTGMHDDLIKTFNICSEKLVTIPNPAFEFIANDFKNNINKNQKNEFLFVGRLKPQKGLLNLLKAFQIAQKKNQSIHLTIVGDGQEKESLMKYVDEHNLDKHVSFEGYQANTSHYYKRAKATLLTSYFEGFPNVLVESIAVGTPVISFNCPSGPTDIISPGINGILVKHLDVIEFSKAILSIANEEIQFKKEEIIKSSLKFSTDSIISKYEEVLFES